MDIHHILEVIVFLALLALTLSLEVSAWLVLQVTVALLLPRNVSLVVLVKLHLQEVNV